MPSIRRHPRWSRWIVGAIAVAILAAAALIGLLATRTDPVGDGTSLRLPGGPTSAIDPRPVSLDASLWLPARTPAPAVILAHGFGGSKESVRTQAAALTDLGFVVLAYSARGFGTSTGQISVNSPDFEVADARALIDYLGTRPEVTQDAPQDPRIGIAGGSYGGALALLTAGYDRRVDAIAADITWNDLQSSLFGQSASTSPGIGGQAGGIGSGVYKQQWTSWFFSVGLIDPQVTACGRFTPQWCAAYLDAAERGQVSDQSSALMRASSPASITDRITVPTLIGAGEADSLFPLAQANANAQQIMAAHPQVPVKVVWHGGGHDGGIDESERITALMGDWFSTFLGGQAGSTSQDGSTGQAGATGQAASTTDFEYTRTSGAISTQNSRPAPVILRAGQYPGLSGTSQLDVRLTPAAPVQRVLAPAGGSPAAISSLPGIGAAMGSLGSLAALPLPGQTAAFDSPPLETAATIVGASAVRLRLSAPQPVTDVALFASLRIVSPGGREFLPAGLVAPIRLPSLGPEPTDIEVQLPAIVADVNVGDRVRLVVGTTDQAYRLPQRTAVYQVALADETLTMPLVAGVPIATGIPAYAWLLATIPLAIAVLILLAIARPRPSRPGRPLVREDLRNVPLAIEGLSKTYRGGLRAVDDVSFTVPPGVVLGLLGPNGAGKTTTMRMVMGLISPSAGQIHVFGHLAYPGSPILARVGSLVEGAGFLPHLTGRQNLDLYWRASGRDGDPCLDEVLDIAGLGSAIDRRVRTYSQGMRQRLGIAQAMLGKPDLLLLDEPTNGLDPPQIRAMREVMQRYAAGGRTVIVSSHLLSEVEQTCSHVVVMHHGRLVATGEVATLLAGRTGLRLEDVFLEIVGEGHGIDDEQPAEAR
ncbi:MAG: alpha/beta fold hydrolase [Actinomycetales bacterium]|nr:alpha/beta fold hydrolase [Actinomycetales bacterium]